MKLKSRLVSNRDKYSHIDIRRERKLIYSRQQTKQTGHTKWRVENVEQTKLDELTDTPSVSGNISGKENSKTPRTDLMTNSHDTELKEPIYWVLYLETLFVQFVAHASLQMSTPLLCYVKVAEILGFIKPATPYSFSSFSVDLASNESWRCEPSYKDRSSRPSSTCGAESLTGMTCPYCPKLAGSLKRIPFGS